MTVPTQGDVALMISDARGLASLGMAGGYDDVLYELADALDSLYEQVEALERDNALLRETVRVFEESQIPMVPRAAQKRLDALEAALRGIAENGACASDARVAREALGETA